MISGGVPSSIRPFLFGGRLIALKKKDDGVRPIVVGFVIRRLASKLISRYASAKLLDKLSPVQLGVGVARGMEAAVHATRQFVSELDPDSAVVKLDFRNAFNSIRRDIILEASKEYIPEVYQYIDSSYGSASQLYFNEKIILSESEVQQ